MILNCLKISRCWTVALISMMASHSLADFTYSIDLIGPSSVNAGSPFLIEVFLVSSNPVLNDEQFGIISGNFSVELVSGTSTINQVTGNSIFDSPGAALSPLTVLQSDIDVSDGTPTGSPFGSGYRVKLGTIEGISALSTEISRFRIIDPDSAADDMMFGDFTLIDGFVFPSNDFAMNVMGSSSAVPEPSSLALVAIGAAAVGCRYARRRFGKKSAE